MTISEVGNIFSVVTGNGPIFLDSSIWSKTNPSIATPLASVTITCFLFSIKLEFYSLCNIL